MLKIMPFWLWAVVMVVLVIVGIATGEPAALVIVGASIGLTFLVALVSKWFAGEGSEARDGEFPQHSSALAPPAPPAPPIPTEHCELVAFLADELLLMDEDEASRTAHRLSAVLGDPISEAKLKVFMDTAKWLMSA